ncbi:C4-dicarboxylate ABC transporter substrate-binding protein [Kiloniella litopenaei]|uniref:TRAP transporter small permease protein n=1 Tax=Kiloniella litopenaei TaxID=1549748 RepID=A0A0M2RAN0_9PROT|nr:TRAP transporter small permease subunit [Kiloniella litopenaei]KKJ78701.1 C4-dicarboxylate ABC transporter substrate-binding protein [Kiloniella litopenaei]
MTSFLSFIDRVSNFFGSISKLVILCLVISMIYEVVARYIFDAPTLWAFDISYMLNGTIFLLGAAFTLQADAHVRIDFLSRQLSHKTQQYLNGFVYSFLLGPCFCVFTYIAGTKTYKAFITNEVENVSPWAPVVWPFYSVIAVGLGIFALQFFCEGIKYLRREKIPGEHAGEIDNVEVGNIKIDNTGEKP